jgi:hypothetical protein
MSLTVLPVTSGERLLDGRRIKDIPEQELAEALNLAAVPVPASWKKILCPMDTNGPLAGYRQLIMSAVSEGIWNSQDGTITYSQDFGLEKRSDESA